MAKRQLKAGLGCVQTNVRIQWNPLTKHFIDFIFVETNEVVRRNSNVIVTPQACGQRSSRVAGSERRALAFHFSARIWYMFWMSTCKGKSDLGVCMTSARVLAKGMRPRGADFRFKNVFGRRIRLTCTPQSLVFPLSLSLSLPQR